MQGQLADGVLEQSDLATKAGDDFPARLYVTLDVALDSLPAAERLRIGAARMLYGPDVPVAALCYVWDTKAPAGTFASNAYTDRVRMIVVESGEKRIGEWVSVRRNVLEDYRKIFGEEPGERGREGSLDRTEPPPADA